MYCNPLHSGSRAGPIPAAPSFPRMPPPPAAAVAMAPAAVLLCPDPTTAAVTGNVSNNGSNNNNTLNGYTNNSHYSSYGTRTTDNNNNNNPNNKVSFRDIRMEVRVVSLACLSEELRNDIWYSQSDIEGMRTEARDLCRFLRVNPQAYPPEHTRGLELRISLERQCRKQLTVQGVVEAQRRCTDPVVLANLAQRCSLVPKEMALAQAQKDYCTVYTTSTTTANDHSYSEDNNTKQAPQQAQGQMSTMQAPASRSTSSAVPRYNHNDSKMPAAVAHYSGNNNNNNYHHLNHHHHQNMQHQNMGYGGYNYNHNMNGMMACSQQYPYASSSSPSSNMLQLHHIHHQPITSTEPQHHHVSSSSGANNLEFCMQQQQQQLSQLSLPMDSFEPIPLSTAAVSMPPDESMALLEAVGADGNTKRPSFELFPVEDNHPQARMVRPRLGGYPAA